MSDTKVTEIVRLSKEGMSARAIAIKIGRSASYVRAILERHIELPAKREMYEYAYRNWERARTAARERLDQIA